MRIVTGATSPLPLVLLGPATWTPLTDEAFGPLDPPTRARAESILGTLHARHAGITPALAASLAIAMGQGVRRAPHPWGDVLDRLRRQMRGPDGGRADGPEAREDGGIVLHDAPVRVILRLALPLVARACMRIGRNIVFCTEQAGATRLERQAYQGYHDQLAGVLADLALSDMIRGGQDDDLRLFWADMAFVLRRQGAAAESVAGAAALPSMAPLELSLLLHLHPDPEPRLGPRTRPRLLEAATRRQRSRRSYEGGVVGYRMTQSIDDLGGMASSELANPPVVLYDRIANTGFLTLERPPLREAVRHVLVVGIAPPSVRALPSAAFVKACWFDCMWRFAAFLRSSNMARSAFCWLEADGDDGMRAAWYDLSTLPLVAGLDHLHARGRWGFLKALHWVPSFVNRRGRATPLSLPLPSALEAHAPEVEWCAAAWRRLVRDMAAAGDGTSTPGAHASPGPLNSYHHVHVMALASAPDAPAVDENTVRTAAVERRGALLHAVVAEPGVHLHVSVTAAPARPWEVDKFYCVGAGRSEPLAAPPDDKDKAAFTAYALEQAWLDRLIEDTQRGR